MLLAHGREDFDMNLSDHSQSIPVRIKALKDNVAKLKTVDGADWLNNVFGDWGITGWVKNLVKMGVCVLGRLLIIVIPALLESMYSEID